MKAATLLILAGLAAMALAAMPAVPPPAGNQQQITISNSTPDSAKVCVQITSWMLQAAPLQTSVLCPFTVGELRATAIQQRSAN